MPRTRPTPPLLAALALVLPACTQDYLDITTAPSGAGGVGAASPSSSSAVGGAGGNSAGGGGASACGAWAARYGGAGEDRAPSLAALVDGTIAVTGYLTGEATFGKKKLTGAGSTDAFVGRLDPAGEPLWLKQYGASGVDEGYDIAVDAAGDIVATGIFQDAIDFGQGAVPLAEGGYVVKTDKDGTLAFGRAFTTTKPFGVAIDPSGDVIVAGRFHATTDFGQGPMSADGVDIFVARLDGATGQTKWLDHYEFAADQAAQAVAIAPSGEIVVVGSFEGTVDFGTGTLVAEGLDAFVLTLSSNGTPLWVRSIGGAKDQAAHAVSIGKTGEVVVVGDFEETTDLGGGPLAAAGGTDAFVAAYDLAGVAKWSARFGDADDQVAVDVAIRPDGTIALVGRFAGAIDLGGGPLEPAVDIDGFAAVLDPSGAHLWSGALGGRGGQAAGGVTFAPCGALLVSGGFDGTLDGPVGSLPTTGDVDAYVVSFGLVP